MGATDDDEETGGDPVVKEVNVYLSKQLAERLYLFQYPVRPAGMPYDDMAHLAARIKPKQQRVELEVSVNIHSPNYSKSKGEQIALNVDGGGAGMLSGSSSSSSSQQQQRMYSSDLMDKQVISSVPSVVPPKRYVAGYFRDGELHLTPLKGLLQLRPSFGYLDQADAKGRGSAPAADADDGGGGGGGGGGEEDEQEAKAVTVKFARRETQEAKARRMASYEYISKKQEEEPWLHVRHHQLSAPLAETERAFLLAPSAAETEGFQVSQDEYLARLMPQVTEEHQQRPPMPTNVLSLAELKTMNLADQVKALMINAKVLRFSQLQSLLSKAADATTALRAAQQVALLVQGCWVVKSELLYPKDSCSSYSGAPAESLCRGRDYIMWRFTQSRDVVRKDLSTVVKLPAEDVKAMLEQMSRLKVHKGWEFMLDFDHEFVNRHPEVVQRQQMLWDAKFQTLAKTLKISKADLDRKAKSAAELAATATDKPKRRRTVSRTKSGSERSLSDQSDTDTEGHHHHHKERRRHASGTTERARRNSGRENCGNLSSSQESLSDLAPPEPVRVKTEKPEPTASGGGGAVVSSGPPAGVGEAAEAAAANNGTPTASADLKKELGEFVGERLSTRFVLTLSELKTQLHRFLAGCPAGHVLGTGVSEKLLERAVYDCGGVRGGQTPAGEAIFVMQRVGDSLDPVRATIFELPSLTKGITYAALKARLEEKGLAVSESDVRKVLRQYFVARGRSWLLKGTVSES